MTRSPSSGTSVRTYPSARPSTALVTRPTTLSFQTISSPTFAAGTSRMRRRRFTCPRCRSRAIGYGDYWVNADFWDRSLQNWQSEFLAIGCMAVFTVYLRQRGSPESKPVGAPHDETGVSN